MQIPLAGVIGNEATEDHLWKHGLMFAHARAVWHGPAKYFEQKAVGRADQFGQLRDPPERLLMIGPDRTGRVLTIVLELPDNDQRSHVVTGWVASPAERTRYDRPGGRMRRR